MSMMRMADGRAFLIALLILLLGGGVGAIDIYLAPIAYHDESGAESQDPKRPAEDLFQRLVKADLSQSVSLRKVEGAGQPPPESFLDAVRLSESQGYAYLLYGYVKRTTYSYYAEVKLFSQESKALSSAFIDSDDDQHYERFVDELSNKIITYISNDLGMGPPCPRNGPARNILTLPITIGYWTPTGGGWSAAMAGLVCADLSLRFVPALPLFRILNMPGFLALGLDAEYGLGMNQPGLETFFLHAVRLRLPVEVFLDLGSSHRLGLGVGPLLEIDTMLQSRLYSSTVTETTIIPGISFSLQYLYALSGSVSLGLATIVDVAFYSQPLVMFSPRLSVDFRLAGSSEKQE